MSALGQKRTCAMQNGMSALPLKADVCGANRHVCFGPIADMLSADVVAPLCGWRRADLRPDYSMQEAARAKRRLDDAARIDADSFGISYPEPGYLLIGATSEAWRCAF
jgi:hypothetical protein